MKQSVYEFKELFKEKLLSYGLMKRASSSIQFRLKECPKCGDRNFHCYIKIDSSTDGPMVYNCFKCNSHGIVDQKFIDGIGLIDLDGVELPKFDFNGIRKLNVGETISTKISGITIADTDRTDLICSYIESRVGKVPSLTDLQYFYYVGNPKKYVTDYLGIENIDSLRNRFWFQMTNGNIIGRYKNDNVDPRWLRYKTSKCKQAGIYRISTPIDLYQPINVIITEGVMDSIGLYYNFDGCTNNLFVSVLGRNYNKGWMYAIDRGIFGDSVSVKIFKDADVPTDMIWMDNNTRKLFKNVDIYENIAAKDYGVLPDQLDIHRVKRIVLKGI